MQIEINRPWISSFSFKTAPYSDGRLEQIHKLSRNFVASLDLGCPGVNHVKIYERHNPGKMDPRERYKLWVSSWKQIYAEVGQIIRLLKKFRKTVRFPKLTEEQNRWALTGTVNGSNANAAMILRSLSERHLARMQETAQVLLNARYNAKLAATEARRRAKAVEA